jgi:alpha-L-fucosidase
LPGHAGRRRPDFGGAAARKYDSRMTQVPRSLSVAALLLFASSFPSPRAAAQDAKKNDAETVKAEHAEIGVDEKPAAHTTHPDAQWFPDAAQGLFIHWGLASVRAMNISWPMIPGRPLANRELTAAERERVVRESDYNLNGKPNAITPNEYWSVVKDFHPDRYDPDLWIRAAKDAGFTYAVMTTKHHEGFAMWPSAYGDFNTNNYAKGVDLVRPFVEACRRHGLKVGLYFSGPDWHFDREYMSFLYGGARRKNPLLPSLDADLKPRPGPPDPEAVARHQAEYAALVRGQIEELLTRYGRIDVLWFDGKPAIPDAEKVITPERIRELQPGIVINPRLHGHGDYQTFERTLPREGRPEGLEWGEYCNTWTRSWAHENIPFRAPAFVLGQLATSRSWGINYLLGVGPMSNGELTPAIYENMAAVSGWMKDHRSSIHGASRLPKGESASVPATARAGTRYLFAIPAFKDGSSGYPEDQLPATDTTLTLTGATKPKAVALMGSDAKLDSQYKDGVLSVALPASLRSKTVDVVEVTLSE